MYERTRSQQESTAPLVNPHPVPIGWLKGFLIDLHCLLVSQNCLEVCYVCISQVCVALETPLRMKRPRRV
ncbi:hypothetical protein DUNSADRAFT_7954 [Dunaliella salina]|uniref:Encoded protein n=1 Tax=Dunaliella salina TaxID=3046 RepID=A0ABQ7H619_DUNSA|nr:hypothetical protein DUNSADRAFT_7954 [Dunaliella salina]|eukprot:KAF5842301.1 hypothetical protein DUNSADRAFT_7954 [Dunaliella salina]